MHIASLLKDPGEPIPAPATLHGALGYAPSASDVAGALFDAVRCLEDPTAVPLELDSAFAEHTRAARVRYLDDRWTWRR